MALSRQTVPSLDELGEIQAEIARATSLDELRLQFDRLRILRAAYSDDFDALLAVSDVQDAILEHARTLRGKVPSASFDSPAASFQGVAPTASDDTERAPIPPDVQRLGPKDWQRIIYVGLFFAILIFAAFFYLIQTARRLNLESPEQSQSTPAQTKQTPKAEPVAQQTTPEQPAVRLYTDLVPGTVTIDETAPKDLKDGELTLSDLQPGQHTLKVTGASGEAQFGFDVAAGGVPTVAGLPTATNAMAVLVETNGNSARLVTSSELSDVTVDGKPAGEAGPDGLSIADLDKSDHLLQVTEGKDRQRFILTYSAAPTLTVYLKSDPSVGTVVLVTKQDGADVYINDHLYRRRTEAGQLRIPLKVGFYTIRVHKSGFIDPPPATVEVKKADETALTFPMQAAPQIATLQVKGALPGTMVYIDHDFASLVSADGQATIANVKPGVHTVELRRDQALPKRFERTFNTGDVIVLSGPEVTLDHAVVDSALPAPNPATASSAAAAPQNYAMQMDGQIVRKGGGFVAYHVPHVSGHYTFAGQARLGGILKHGKLQWYAGYQDPENYILFVVDGKHASIRQVRNGTETEISRIPFDADSQSWVQVDLSVRHDSLNARVKSPLTGWTDLGNVSSDGQDFTQGKVGFYIPDKDEVAIANFRFAPR